MDKISQESKKAPVVEKKPFLHGFAKIANGIFVILLVPTYSLFLFFGVFVRISLFNVQHFALNLSLICYVIYPLATVILAVYNNRFKIPRLKQKAENLPTVGIQVIGRGQSYEQFFAVMNNIRNLEYPHFLIKKVILAVDGNDAKNDDMINVFLQLYPDSIKLQLNQHFSMHSQQQTKLLLQTYRNNQHIIISQPHGGRRQVKYTAFNFSSDGTEYVFHSDSDTLASHNALQSMAKTVSGYNRENPDLKPCGGGVGS